MTSYTSDNTNFYNDLLNDYNTSVFNVLYTITLLYPPKRMDDILQKNSNPVEVNLVNVSLKYLTQFNQFIQLILQKPHTLKTNAEFSDIIEYLELPSNTSYTAHQEWGRKYWKFLHQTSIILFTRRREENYQALYESFYGVIYNLAIILPCDVCKTNFQSKFIDSQLLAGEIYPLLNTDPIKAIYDLHTYVNQHTNYTKYKDYSFQDFLAEHNLKTVTD